MANDEDELVPGSPTTSAAAQGEAAWLTAPPPGSAFATAFSTLAGPQYGPRPWPAVPLLGKTQEAPPTQHEVTLVMRPEKPRQHILGFGAAMTEAAAQVIFSSPERDSILDDLFLPMDRGGAGLSCLRVCIGSSDFSLDEVEFSRSRGLELLVPALRAARRRNPRLELLASQWSAPADMKTSGSLVGGTLKDDCIQAYCFYLLKALLFFEKQGLHIAAMTLQNEPFAETDYPSMLLSARQQAALARELVPMLRRNGLATLVVGHDHNFSHKAEAVELLGLAGDVLDGTAWHAYEGSEANLADEVIQGNGIFVTEQTAHSDRPRDADFLKDARWMLQHVLMGPLLAGSRCALSWNLALDPGFGPRLPTAPGNCRGIVEVPAVGKHERSPEFFALAHVCHATSALAGQGTWRVYSKSSSSKVGIAAFRSGCGGTCGALLHNKSPGAVLATLKSGDRTLARLHLPGESLVSVAGLQPPTRPCALSGPGRPRVPVDAYCLPGAMFALRSRSHGTFLAAHGEHDNVLYQSESREPGEWERWTAVEVGERGVALRSCFGSFLGRGGDGKLALVGSWFEKIVFTILAMPDGSVAFYSEAGCLHMPGEKQREPRLSQARIAAWEVFEIVSPCRLPRTAFALRSLSQGAFLSAPLPLDVELDGAAPEARVRLAACSEPGDDELWAAVEVSAQTYALRSWHGTYLGRSDSGELLQVNSCRRALAVAPFAFSGGAVGFDSDVGSLQVAVPAGGGPTNLVCAASRAREALVPMPSRKLPPSAPFTLQSAEHGTFLAVAADGGVFQLSAKEPDESGHWLCDYEGVPECLPDAFFLRASPSGAYLAAGIGGGLCIALAAVEALLLELSAHGDGTVSIVARSHKKGSLVLPARAGQPKLLPRPLGREERLLVRYSPADRGRPGECPPRT